MTGKVKNFDGFPILVPNDITGETSDYYISYNSRDTGIYGCDTTALVITKPGKIGKFLILDGDHRDSYAEIKENDGTCQDCINYFKTNHDKQSKFSENWDEMFVFVEGEGLKVIKDPDCVSA